MPYSIHWEPNGVYKKYTGCVTGQEFFRAVKQVNSQPNFETFHYVINDFLDCVEFLPSKSEQEDAVAAAIGAHMSNSRFVAAFVAVNPEVVASLRSMAAQTQSCMQVCLFNNLTDARRWVNSRQANPGLGIHSQSKS